ncbi:MAG TPA: hypothetical protein VJM11_08545 [Nevskiaceae bacterium]|nr:hypothetical protein [Nevskiaceae bacterium]
MSRDIRKLLQDGHGRMPGVYDASGYRLSASDAVAAAGLFGHASTTDSHWLDAPGWWIRVKPLRWAAAIAGVSFLSHHVSLIDLVEIPRQLLSTLA